MTNQRGLSIVETLIAVAVIGVVFVGLAAVQVSSMHVTSDASIESELLAEAVTRFEEVRTEVLSNFASLYLACTSGSCGEGLGEDVILERASVTPEGGSRELLMGMLELQVTVEKRGRTLFFKQYVSCLDADEVPTLSDPGVCNS